MNASLYTTEILRLAASIPFDDRIAQPMASVEKRSPVCGSWLVVDLDLDEAGRVVRTGMVVRTCAFGQASAALMAAHVVGRSANELAEARGQLAAWLAGEGPLPRWPGLAVLEPALPHRGRHAAILLAFEAAAEAARQAARSEAA